jgi:hypothetical protein
MSAAMSAAMMTTRRGMAKRKVPRLREKVLVTRMTQKKRLMTKMTRSMMKKVMRTRRTRSTRKKLVWTRPTRSMTRWQSTSWKLFVSSFQGTTQCPWR